MSYSVKIEIKDGEASVGQPFYAPPDGIYVLNGHTDEQNETITATRFADDGHVIVQATGTARKS